MAWAWGYFKTPWVVLIENQDWEPLTRTNSDILQMEKLSSSVWMASPKVMHRMSLCLHVSSYSPLPGTACFFDHHSYWRRKWHLYLIFFLYCNLGTCSRNWCIFSVRFFPFLLVPWKESMKHKTLNVDTAQFCMEGVSWDINYFSSFCACQGPFS